MIFPPLSELTPGDLYYISDKKVRKRVLKKTVGGSCYSFYFFIENLKNDFGRMSDLFLTKLIKYDIITVNSVIMNSYTIQ